VKYNDSKKNLDLPNNTQYLKLAWDTFYLQIFDYKKESQDIDVWIKGNDYRVKNILDLGCGAGRHLIELSKLGYKCVGIDKDRAILNYANRLAKSENTNIKFISSDILKNPSSAPRNRFDLVIGMHLSFPIVNLRKVINYIRKTFSPSGPNLLIFGFLIGDTNLLEKVATSIDTAVLEKLFLVRLNKMELKEERNEYRWKETYIIKSINRKINIEKINYRSLWFISYDEFQKIVKNNIIVDQIHKEPTGIKGLKGISVYGKFKT